MQKGRRQAPRTTFEKLTRAIVSVPKAEVDAKANAYKRKRAKKRKAKKRTA